MASVRARYSPASNREFAGQAPRTGESLGKKSGTWTEVFAGNADEAFQAWHQARYNNAIAEAGKREFNIPFYCNVWLAYPPAARAAHRHRWIGYPSGGPVQADPDLEGSRACDRRDWPGHLRDYPDFVLISRHLRTPG